MKTELPKSYACFLAFSGIVAYIKNKESTVSGWVENGK
jgi:hypothetical protein